MDFKNGDVVRFKSSEFNMVVVNPNAPKYSDGTGGESGMVECKWFDPTVIEGKVRGFVREKFFPFELALVTSD